MLLFEILEKPVMVQLTSSDSADGIKLAEAKMDTNFVYIL